MCEKKLTVPVIPHFQLSKALMSEIGIFIEFHFYIKKKSLVKEN